MKVFKKANFHTHTNFCDGQNTAEEMILSAIEKGFDALGFSSHCIHPLDPDFYSPFDSNWHIPFDKVSAYAEEIRSLQKKYENQIKIFLGFEADYFSSASTGSAIPDKKAYAQFKPDFLIGSVHFVDTPLGFYTVDHKTTEVLKNLKHFYSTGNGKIDGEKAVCDYFAAQREMLKKGQFEIWGHPDLIRKRNGELCFFDENDSWYKEELEATAKEAAKAGVIAEINTGAIYRKSMDDCYPSAFFLELLHSKGVPVCIDSDAHTTDGLDCAFERASALAKKTGYTELVYPGNIVIAL